MKKDEYIKCYSIDNYSRIIYSVVIIILLLKLKFIILIKLSILKFLLWYDNLMMCDDIIEYYKINDNDNNNRVKCDNIYNLINIKI